MQVILDGKPLPAGRIFCIGLNYLEHVEEFKTHKPEPTIFMKPATSIVPAGATLPAVFAGEPVHYETELAVLIGQSGKPARADEADTLIAGLGIGLDLTLRATQKGRLFEQRLPWEISKAFDGSAPLAPFHAYDRRRDDLRHLQFTGSISGQLRQQGDSAKMIAGITDIIIAIAQYWTLLPGDIILTGTPAGVGPLHPGDSIQAVDHRGVTHTWNCC